jgi:hypothetical protein
LFACALNSLIPFYLRGMQKTTFESDRIEVTQSKDRFEIRIGAKIPALQFAMLSAWLVAWTVAGIYVLSQVFTIQGDSQIFMIVWLAFWAYFEYRIGSAWLWRKYGREVFCIEGNEVQLRFEVAYGGRAETFSCEDIKGFHNLDKDKSAFVKSFYASFWVIGGETIGFFHKGRIKTFGRQISSNDADKLITLIKKHLA